MISVIVLAFMLQTLWTIRYVNVLLFERLCVLVARLGAC